MKKITFMLALLVLIFTSVQSAFATDAKWEQKRIASVSAAVEGLDNLVNGYYVLRNVGRKTFLRENDDKGLYLWNATNGSDELTAVQTAFVGKRALMSSVVYITKNEGTSYYTMQFKSGQYIGTTLPHGSAATSNATAGEVEMSYISGNQFAFRPKDSEWANGNGDGGYTEGTFTGWEKATPGANGNGAYQLFPVELEKDPIVDVTWTVKAGDNTIGTFTSEVNEGTTITELPTMPSMSYYYTNPTLVAPEDPVVSTDNCSFTINVTEGETPYTLSTAANPVWYTVKFRNNDNKHLCHVLSSDANIGSQRTLSEDFCKGNGKKETFDGFLWAFVKDGFGVKLLNKQTGKYVKCESNNGAAATLNATNATIFIAKTNTSNNNAGFSLQFPNATTAYLGDHANNSRLGSWNTTQADTQNDGGSSFTIQLADVEATVAIAKALAIDSLSNLSVKDESATMLTASTAASVEAAKTAAETATTIAAIDAAYGRFYYPVADANAYYRIQNINNITKKYLTSASIFVGTDGSLATSYKKDNNIDRKIRRVADNANFVSQLWQLVANGDGTYKIKNANTGCRMSSNAAPIDMPIDVNGGGDYTLKAVPSATFAGNDAATMLQMVVNNNIINAFDGNAQDIIQAYNDKNDKGGYWQFIKVTEVPVAISAANYATVAYPFAVQVPANSGITAYSVSEVNGGYLILNEITDGIIPAGQGAILYHEGETTANLTITTTSKTLADNKLVGATAKRIGFDGNDTYVLALNSENKAAFLKSELTTVPANKAYVLASTLPSTEAAATALNFNFGQVTAINAAQTNTKNNVEYYDLNGRRVLYPANGIFVTNTGKKVFIK